jgi:hypothetical protein
MALDSMSLLSGKYLQAEQVSPGLVQTFRARDSATGRPVFVHRIGDSDCAEQASLLKLLLSCLYRSPAVKELVLEVKEDAEACYVVTEAAPQCFLLREWLEFEAKTPDDSSSGSTGMPSPAPISEPEERPSRASDEILLPAPFVSDRQPGPPQAAPTKVIRPLPPEFSPPPLESLSAALAASEQRGELDHALAAAPARAVAPENQAKMGFRFGEGGFSREPQQRELPQPAVQRPVGVLPLDEFDLLFQEPVPPRPQPSRPVSAPSPRQKPARPMTGPAAPLAQRPAALGSGALTPLILPSAAQTVLESALAAQAASQKNRKLIIGAAAVLLIVLAIVLYLLMGARVQ